MEKNYLNWCCAFRNFDLLKIFIKLFLKKSSIELVLKESNEKFMKALSNLNSIKELNLDLS